MRLLLLALLFCPAAVGAAVPRNLARINLNHVHDLSENCTSSLTGTFFVEDVSHLTEGVNKCEDKFFCKVQGLLASLKHFCTKSKMLVRSLETYNNHRNLDCTEAVQGVTRTGNEITVSKLLMKLMHCVRHRNYSGTK